MLKNLLKYKKLWYNHVTFLGGEPFIQPVFFDALKLAKHLGYTILVTTNCTTLHIDMQAKKLLPYIDELFISVEAIDQALQKKISRTNVYVRWEKVFQNIQTYWKGTFLKANIVITKDNLPFLKEIVLFLCNKNIKDISITYPDIAYKYYGKEHILSKVAPTYTECMKIIPWVVDICNTFGVHCNIVDFPFCSFPKNRLDTYISLTDDLHYQARLKIEHTWATLEHSTENKKSTEYPRSRENTKVCHGCKFEGICWGPSSDYERLYGLEEIQAIK